MSPFRRFTPSTMNTNDMSRELRENAHQQMLREHAERKLQRREDHHKRKHERTPIPITLV